MITESKRSLRVRKDPKYLNSDVTQTLIKEQDPDKVSFSQLKSHHDYSSAQNQKVQDAKILAKLINKINKSYRTYLNDATTHQIEIEKPSPVPKPVKTQPTPQPTKKMPPTPKQPKKQQANKSSKTVYNFKNQYPTTTKQPQAFKYNESYINQLKQLSSLPIQGIVNKGIFTDQLKKLQTLYPDMKNISYQSLTQNTNPNLFSSSTTSSQPKVKKQSPPQQQQQQKSLFNQEKLFKRSAYHVAIAYHIYLKNLKQKGGVIGNEIDPTYYAKKLKEARSE